MADLPNAEHGHIGIEDVSTGYNLKVESDGALNVNANIGALPSIPEGATPLTIDAFGDISSTTGVDTYYTVTNGKTLTIQRITGGAENSNNGSIVELFEDVNSDLSVLVRIETIFVNGSTQQVGVNELFEGDGTRRIVLRRRRYLANAKEMWGRWEGYEETT